VERPANAVEMALCYFYLTCGRFIGILSTVFYVRSLTVRYEDVVKNWCMFL